MEWRSLFALIIWIVINAPCEAAEPTIVRFGIPTGLDTSATNVVKQFVSAVNNRIKGVGEIVALPQASNALAALRKEEIQLAAIPSGTLVASKADGLAVFDIPFALNDLTETNRLQQGVVGDAMLAALSSQKLVGLGYWNIAMRHLLGPEIRNAEGLKGKKILTSSFSPQTRSALIALGSNPVNIPAGEIQSALVAGAADTAELSSSFILDSKLYQAKPAVMEAGFRPQVLVIAATESIWSKLPFQIQSVIADEVRAASLNFERTVLQKEAAAFSELKEKGVQTISWSPNDLTDIRRSVLESASKDDITSKDKLVLAALTSIGEEQRNAFPRNDALNPVNVLGGRKTLFFVTDRKLEAAQDPNYKLGSARGTLIYGTVDIDLGRQRAVAGPSDNASIKDVAQFAGLDTFIDALKKSLREAGRKEVFIFVHGFNNKFRDAAESTAFLVDDLNYKGVPIVFSWPSDGTALRYPNDEQEAETSRDTLVAFLSKLIGIPEISRIHILAHSMGGRVLGSALEWMSTMPASERTALHNVIFAAPDVYVTRFSQYLSRIRNSANQITLYASKADQALLCSQFIHDGARAGQVGDLMIVDQAIQTIDVSNAETESFTSRIAGQLPGGQFLNWLLRDSCRSGHSYVTRNFSVINDLHALIVNDERPDQRILLKMRPFNQYHYWEMKNVVR